MSVPDFNFIYALVPPTVSGWFLSNFQGVLSSPSFKNIVSFFYIADLGSVGGHDLVMLSPWENFQIAPIPKILEISSLFNHFCASIAK